MPVRLSTLLPLFFAACLTACYQDKNADELDPYFFEPDPGANPFDRYAAVPDSLKTLFYRDDFFTADDWYTGHDGQFSAVIAGGLYDIRNNDETTLQWVTKTVALDYARNFEVEALLSVQSATPDDGAGLLLGGAGGEDFICMLFDDENRCTILGYEDGENKYNTFHPWSNTLPYYRSGEPTLVTIRKVQDKYYFFVNQRLIRTVPVDPHLDETIGFMAKGDATMQVDFISAYYLDI